VYLEHTATEGKVEVHLINEDKLFRFLFFEFSLVITLQTDLFEFNYLNEVVNSFFIILKVKVTKCSECHVLRKFEDFTILDV
jgi:hypothetical protein